MSGVGVGWLGLALSLGFLVVLGLVGDRSWGGELNPGPSLHVLRGWGCRPDEGDDGELRFWEVGSAEEGNWRWWWWPDGGELGGVDLVDDLWW